MKIIETVEIDNIQYINSIQEDEKVDIIDEEWDTSIKDVSNIMKQDFPEYTKRMRKCLLSLNKNGVTHDDKSRIARYAKSYKLPYKNVIAIYSGVL